MLRIVASRTASDCSFDSQRSTQAFCQMPGTQPTAARFGDRQLIYSLEARNPFNLKIDVSCRLRCSALPRLYAGARSIQPNLPQISVNGWNVRLLPVFD
jgi:hypothetical protein